MVTEDHSWWEREVLALVDALHPQPTWRLSSRALIVDVRASLPRVRQRLSSDPRRLSSVRPHDVLEHAD